MLMPERKLHSLALSWLLLLSFLATLLAACQSGPDLPTGRLAFVRHNDLWVADQLGGEPRRITTVAPGSLVDDPRWSPDGQRIAYVQSLPTEFDPDDILSALPPSDIMVVNADGSQPKLVLAHGRPGVQLRTPAWLPDASGLLYTEFTAIVKDNKPAGVHIALRRLDFSSLSTTLVLPDALNADVSPDGRQITYVPSFNALTPTGIWLADISGSNPRLLFHHPDFDEYHAPRFSPDGQHIVFTAAGGPDVPGGATPVARALSFPILFRIFPVSAHGLPADLWLIDIDGTNLRRLTHVREDMPTPAWLPNSSGLVFQGLRGIYLYDLSIGRLRFLDDQGWHGGLHVAPPS